LPKKLQTCGEGRSGSLIKELDTDHANKLIQSLCSYFKQTGMSFSFYYKLKEQEGGTGPVLGVLYQWEGEEVGKGYSRVNMVQILCTHVRKWRNEIC
jgi:hypothetical protein